MICDTILKILPDETTIRTPPVEYTAMSQVSPLLMGTPITTTLIQKQLIILVRSLTHVPLQRTYITKLSVPFRSGRTLLTAAAKIISILSQEPVSATNLFYRIHRHHIRAALLRAAGKIISGLTAEQDRTKTTILGSSKDLRTLMMG